MKQEIHQANSERDAAHRDNIAHEQEKVRFLVLVTSTRTVLMLIQAQLQSVADITNVYVASRASNVYIDIDFHSIGSIETTGTGSTGAKRCKSRVFQCMLYFGQLSAVPQLHALIGTCQHST